MEQRESKYPISEIFTSPQGEGMYTGAVMTFIRLAGCTVGKPFKGEQALDSDKNFKSIPVEINGRFAPQAVLPIYTEQCTLYDGRKFACDTDYRVKQRLTIKEIIAQIPSDVQYACLTGGEPMMHPILPLIDALHEAGKEVHLETSGTIPLNNVFPTFTSHAYVWITISPKFGVLPEMVKIANEVKILVDKDFNPGNLSEAIRNHKRLYIQPINSEFEVNHENLRLVLELQKKYPKWRVSLQLHKVLSHYIDELVR